MKPNPELVSETKAWFVKANHDLRMTELALNDSPPLTDLAVYHAQQAAEKAMKGFLTWKERIFRKTHNLVELGEACVTMLPELESIFHDAAYLSGYAWQYRYPGDMEDPSIDEAKSALNQSRKVVESILEKLPVEVRP